MMINTLQAILYLYPTLSPGPDFTLTPQSDGPAVIRTWTTTVAPQPTVEQLTAAWDVMELGAAQTAQIEALAVPYQAALQAPVAYMGTTFDADSQSQIVVAHAMLVYAVEGAVPAGFYFADADGNKVPMTLTQLQGLGSAIAGNYLPVFQKWTELKAQVMAATTLEEVQAVVW